MKRTALLSIGISFTLLGIEGVAVFFFARPLTALFIADAPAVVDSGTRFLRVMALFLGFMGVQQVMGSAFRGSGSTIIAAALAVLSLWALRFPLNFGLSRHTALGVEGVWWAFPVSNVLTSVAALFWFRRGTWKKRALMHNM